MCPPFLKINFSECSILIRCYFLQTFKWFSPLSSCLYGFWWESAVIFILVPLWVKSFFFLSVASSFPLCLLTKIDRDMQMNYAMAGSVHLSLFLLCVLWPSTICGFVSVIVKQNFTVRKIPRHDFFMSLSTPPSLTSPLITPVPFSFGKEVLFSHGPFLLDSSFSPRKNVSGFCGGVLKFTGSYPGCVQLPDESTKGILHLFAVFWASGVSFLFFLTVTISVLTYFCMLFRVVYIFFPLETLTY